MPHLEGEASPFTIRSADPARDGDACAAIYAPSVIDSAVSFEEVAPAGDEMARRIATAPAWLVAEGDREVVGYAYASSHRSRAAYRWAVDVSAYVDAAHRGKGLGRALYEVLFERIRADGYWIAVAGITLPNPASERLHESMGFRPVGTYRRIGWKAGAWHDVQWWQLDLRPGDETQPAEPRAPGE
jgi:L-amino acid N-acyltransferase YncA